MKINKFILVFIGIVLVATLVTASLLGAFNKDVGLTKAEKNALASIGITAPTIAPLSCNGKECNTCMKEFNPATNITTGAGCVTIPQRYCSEWSNCSVEVEGQCIQQGMNCVEYTDYTQQELETMLENAVKKRLEGIANATIGRQADAKDVKTNEGTITIKEVK